MTTSLDKIKDIIEYSIELDRVRTQSIMLKSIIEDKDKLCIPDSRLDELCQDYKKLIDDIIKITNIIHSIKLYVPEDEKSKAI